MNSNYGKSGANSFDFDLGIGNNRPRPLNDQKNKTSSYSSYSSTSSYSQPAAKPTPSWQPNKPSWTHQPAPARSAGATRGELGGTTSMAGDIFGKSWNSPAPPSGPGAGIGLVVNKDPSLFGDLVSSALGQNKSTGSAPLKSSAPAKNSFSMGGVVNSLPEASASAKGSGNNWDTSDSFGSFVGVTNTSGGYGSTANGMNKGSTPPMSSLSGGGIGRGGGGLGMSSQRDPFGSLLDFGAKPSSGGGNLKSAASGKANDVNTDDVGFGNFQNAKPSSGGDNLKSAASGKATLVNTDEFGFGNFQNAKPSSGGDNLKSAASGKANLVNTDEFGFGNFQNAKPSSGGGNLNFVAPSKATNPVNSDGFGFGFGNFQNSSSTSATDPLNMFSPSNTASLGTRQKSSESDSFDNFFSPSSSSASVAATQHAETQQFPEGDDWCMETGIGEHDSGNTTELEGLPPPPAGVSASTAKSKGMDNYKQGQYADAIKWLSWAVILLGKSSGIDGKIEVLSCRASCYKEVGEYKKAVADCTEVLQHDEKNVAVLVQRALLYESMEKYKLGADDLRAVMKIDPLNRVARSTIHRLNKMAG